VFNEKEQSLNGALAARAVRLQGQRDFVGLRSVMDADVVLEFPFHPNGAEVHHGADELIRLFSIINVFDTLSIEPVAVFDTGSDTVVVEGRSVGTYRSGTANYANHYLFVLTIRDGKITRWREFYNPLPAIEFYANYDDNVRFNEAAEA
jgi:ketosteroid isomerase-like protein